MTSRMKAIVLMSQKQSCIEKSYDYAVLLQTIIHHEGGRTG